jgi:hypothetical protein
MTNRNLTHAVGGDLLGGHLLQGEWLPLVDYEPQCQLIEKMVGEPVLEIRQQPNGSLWFVTDERVYRPD